MNRKSFAASFIRVHLQNMHEGQINSIIFLICYLIATLQFIYKLGLKENYLMQFLSYFVLQNIISKQNILIVGICLILIYSILRVFIYISTYKTLQNKSGKNQIIKYFRTGFVNYFRFFVHTVFYFPVIIACIDIIDAQNIENPVFQVLAWITILLYTLSFTITKILNSKQNFIIETNSGQSTLQTVNPLLAFDYFRIFYILISQNIILQIGSLALYIIIESYFMYRWPIISYRYNIYRQIIIVIGYLFTFYKIIQFAGQINGLNPIFLTIIIVIAIFGIIVLIKKREKIITQKQQNFVQKLKYLFNEVSNEKVEHIQKNNILSLFIVNHKKTCKLQTCICSKIIKFYIEKDQKSNQSFENGLKLQTFWYQFIVDQIRTKHQIIEHKKIVLSQLINKMNILQESLIFCSQILSFKLNKTNQAFLLLQNMMLILRKKQLQEEIFQGKCVFLIALMSENNIQNLKKSTQTNQYCREYFEFHQCNQKILTSINEAKGVAFKFWTEMKYYDPDEEKLLLYLKKLDNQDFKIQKNYQKLKKISKTNSIQVDQQIRLYEKNVFNIQRKSLSIVQQKEIEPLIKKQNYEMNISKQASLFFDTSNTGICTHSINAQDFGLIFNKNKIFKNLFQKTFVITKLYDLIIKQLQSEHDQAISQFTTQQNINYSHDYAYLKVNNSCIKKFKIFSQVIPSLEEGLKIASFFNCQIFEQENSNTPILGINEKFQVLYANSEVFQNILQVQISQQNLKQKKIQIQQKQQSLNSENQFYSLQSENFKKSITNLSIQICQSSYIVNQFKIVGKTQKIIFLQMRNTQQLNNSKLQQRALKQYEQKQALKALFNLDKKTISVKFKTNFFQSEIFRQIVKHQQSQEIVQKINKLQKVYQSSIGRSSGKLKLILIICLIVFLLLGLISSMMLIFSVTNESQLFISQKLILDQIDQISNQIGKGLTALREINVNSYLGTNLQYMNFMYQKLFASKQQIKQNIQILSQFYVDEMIIETQTLPLNIQNAYQVDKYIAIQNFIVSRLTTLYYQGEGALNFSPMKSQISIPYTSIECNFFQANQNGILKIIPSLFNKTEVMYQTYVIETINSFDNQKIIIAFSVAILLFIGILFVVTRFQSHDTKVLNFTFSFIQELKSEKISGRIKLLKNYDNHQKNNQNKSILKEEKHQHLIVDQIIQIPQNQQSSSERSNCLSNSNIESIMDLNQNQKRQHLNNQTLENDYICKNRRRMNFKIENWWTKIGGSIFFFMIPLSYLVFAISDHFVTNNRILQWYYFQQNLLTLEQISQFGYLYLLQLGPLQIQIGLSGNIISKIDQFYIKYRTLQIMEKQFIQPGSNYWKILNSIQYKNICDQVQQFQPSQAYGVNLTRQECQTLSNSVLTLGMRSAFNYYLQSSRQVAYKNQYTYSYNHNQRIEYMTSSELEQVRRLSQYIAQINQLLKNAFYQDFNIYNRHSFDVFGSFFIFFVLVYHETCSITKNKKIVCNSINHEANFILKSIKKQQVLIVSPKRRKNVSNNVKDISTERAKALKS